MISSAEYRSLRNKRKAKYRNVPVVVDGVRFDSKREAARWAELQRLERLGTISTLRRQVPFVLAKSVHLEGEKRAKPAIRAVIDFVYFQDNATILEDVKSSITAATGVWRLKKHLIKALYGHDVREIR